MCKCAYKYINLSAGKDACANPLCDKSHSIFETVDDIVQCPYRSHEVSKCPFFADSLY